MRKYAREQARLGRFSRCLCRPFLIIGFLGLIGILQQFSLYILPTPLYPPLHLMAKQIKKVVKVQVRGGQANPAPPLGPALGQAGVDIQGFCTQFNEKTKANMGKMLPVQITVFDDRSFTFIVKQPAATALIMERVKPKIEKGSGEPNRTKVGSITKKDLREIAEIKLPDLNTTDIEAAMRTIEGSARSMGVTVDG